MTKEFKVGDRVIYNGVEAFNGYDDAINVGDIGVVRQIGGVGFLWPYFVEFGKGGLPAGVTFTGADGEEFDCEGLAPMAQGTEINLYEGEAQ